MLRRPPTTLTLTSEDVSTYEDRRSREARESSKNNITSARPASAHRYNQDQLLLASQQSPHARLSPAHVKRRTILDPPVSSSTHAGRAAGWVGDEPASEQDLRAFAAARDRAQLQQQQQQQRRHQQHRARGAGHAVHFTPVPRGTPIPQQQSAAAALAAPHKGGGGGVAGLGVSEIGDDSDFPTAALSSPPEAPALSSSEEEEDREEEEDHEDDDDDDESPEDEEMVDYEQIRALPRSARPAVYAQQNNHNHHHHQHHHQPHHQHHHHHHHQQQQHTPAAPVNLTTPVNNPSTAHGGQIHQQQQTPVPSNHSTTAASQIPQAPLRRVHARTVSAAARAGSAGSGASGIGRGGGFGEAQVPPQQPPLAPPRMTRSRDERIGAPAAGSRRTGR